MKKYIKFLVLLISTMLIYYGCELGVPSEVQSTAGSVNVNGQVVGATTGDPIESVTLRFIIGSQTAGITTDVNGKFSTDIDLQNDSDILIISSKPGYKSDTVSVFATVGANISVPLIKLKQEAGSGSGLSGNAASVYLFLQSSPTVGVKESGANEAVQLVFEVLDSSGVSISFDNAVVLKFSFGSGPGGGEYLYPSSVKTNGLGRGSVTLNTGTKAGVAQIIAEFSSGSKVIRSKPVMIAIHGGLPDQQHFEVAANKLNYPAYGLVGYTIDFTAFVGDKYTNPVRPNTSVYFETTSGIIEGSNVTDELGRALVTLLTQPTPNHTVYGPGFFEVTASTINENSEQIQTQTIRLLSGKPEITVTPSAIDIPNGGTQTFNYTVNDGNGNPLTEGTSISVKVTEGNLKVEGDIDVRLPDTQSKSYTMFSFSAYDSKPDTAMALKAMISIETSGQNGNKKISISGVSK